MRTDPHRRGRDQNAFQTQPPHPQFIHAGGGIRVERRRQPTVEEEVEAVGEKARGEQGDETGLWSDSFAAL
eukprot:5592407-Pyramimonas_sp.AAC.1